MGILPVPARDRRIVDLEARLNRLESELAKAMAGKGLALTCRRPLLRPTMTIRNALPSDVDSMARLLLIVHHMHVVAHPETYRAISHEAAVDCLLRKLEQNAFLRVAEFESTVHGYCSAVIRKSLETPGFAPRQFIYVEEIVVRPESRKSGIGGALIDDLKSFAWQEGVLEIELDVGHFNREAKAFFQSTGFRTLRQRMNTRLDIR